MFQLCAEHGRKSGSSVNQVYLDNLFRPKHALALCFSRLASSVMPSQPVRGSLVVTKTVNIKASGAGGRRKKRSRQRVGTNTSRVHRRRVNATAQSESFESRSDDAAAESSQAQSLENVDHMHLEDSCFSSPEATLHGTVDASYDMYRLMLMAAPAHRCVRVADNTRGVQCLAVATGVQAASGVHIKVPKHQALMQNTDTAQACLNVSKA